MRNVQCFKNYTIPYYSHDLILIQWRSLVEISARHMFCWSARLVDHYIKFYFQIHLCSVIQLGFKATLTLLNYIINDSNN